ncbi:hypothetical protein TI39_contig4112g00007 [Zymoseptoria brevis]|uniref:2EXR domain-containing protein n=1 Tax=Zymoseptoria brevis TaxID=1047168 RepID=A0A0F4GDG7_9PEZI|nr:hypothetical protein TI39_contig4112g00007 [Zymoseptoria brevis]
MADSTKTTRSSKRKRTQVSYSADEYFDALDMDSNEAAAEVAGGDKLSPDDVDQAADDGDDRPEDGEFTRNGKGKAPPKKKVKKAPQSKKRKPKDEKPFRFMDLPPELRDEIYDLCLTEPGGLVLVSKRKDFRKTIVRGIITTETGKAYRGKYRREKPHRRWGYYQPPAMVRGKVKNYGSNISPDQKLVPNLLAVNKQIREEASSVLYKQNIMLEDTIALFNFMTTIGDYNRQLVSTLIIKGWGQGKSCCFPFGIYVADFHR